MTEETISTTPEVSEEQTTLDVEPSQTQPDERTIEDGQQLKPEESSTEGTEIKPQETPKNWEQIAKDNQASFTKS